MNINRLIVITGASRGIGKAAAIQFAATYQKDTHFILLARDLMKLNEVKTQIESVSQKVTIVGIDFSDDSKTFNDYFSLLNESIDHFVYKEVIVLYNHGTLEYGPIIQTNDNELKQKLEVNFVSIWKLLSAIERLFNDKNIKRYHININSSYAHRATANWSVQCTSRSARQMLFECLSKESDSTLVQVLNYDPGLVYTDMLKQAYDSNMFSSEFKDDYEKGNFIKAEDTMRNLINLIKQKQFNKKEVLVEEGNEFDSNVNYGVQLNYKLN